MSLTPGPWRVDENGNVVPEPARDGDGWCVAEVYESEDADLIAAAPDLLEALEEAEQHLKFNRWVGDPHSDRRFAAVQKVRAVIAKARSQDGGLTNDG